MALGVIIFFRGVHGFLACNDPLPGGLLVVEGWAPDYALAATLQEFESNHYDKLYVVGGPLEQGAPLSEYKTYADLGAAVLLRLGMNSNAVQAVPAPWVRQDRTYTAAVSLKQWCGARGVRPRKLHLISEGPHSRRSRLLFEKAMGEGVEVGITAIPGKEYDGAHWWKSSAGVRGVISEAVAYLYARFFFHPAQDPVQAASAAQAHPGRTDGKAYNFGAGFFKKSTNFFIAGDRILPFLKITANSRV